MKNKNMLDGKPNIATEEQCKLPWSGGKNGIYFRCYMCGYKFIPGDYWRFILSPRYGNPLICKDCDGEDILERWYKHNEEGFQKYWYLLKNGYGG